MILVWLATSAASCGGSEGGGGGGGGDGSTFMLDYRGGAAMLLDLRATAAITFSGAKPSIPSYTSIGVAQAGARVLGNGQQIIELAMSSSNSSLDVGDRFSVYVEFARASLGTVIDSGGTVPGVRCDFTWSFANDDSFAPGAECAMKRSGGGYSLTIEQSYDEETQVAGTLTFGPVPNQIIAFTPGGGCASEETCLSLDPGEFEPQTGFCLPSANLKSQAAACSASCGTQLQITVGGSQRCVCTSECGRIATGGGGDPPTCDPAYGCIDI